MSDQVIQKSQEEIIAEAVQTQLEARLKEERDKIARGMLNEGRQRERNVFSKLFEKHGVQIGDDPETAITRLFDDVKQWEERMKLIESDLTTKIEAAFVERDDAFKVRDEAISSHNTYVIRTELTNALGGKAVDPESAIKYLMYEYNFERGEKNTIAIKDRIGSEVLNDEQQPADLSWIVKDFLDRHPFLAKASERMTDVQKEDVTAGGAEFLKKLRGEWSESELQKALDMVANGTIVNKGGKWVVR